MLLNRTRLGTSSLVGTLKHEIIPTALGLAKHRYLQHVLCGVSSPPNHSRWGQSSPESACDVLLLWPVEATTAQSSRINGTVPVRIPIEYGRKATAGKETGATEMSCDFSKAVQQADSTAQVLSFQTQRRQALEKVAPQRQWDSHVKAQSNAFSYIEQWPSKYFRAQGTDVAAHICNTSSARKAVSSKLALESYKNLSQKSNKREEKEEEEKEQGRGGRQKRREEMGRGKRRRKRQKRTRKLPIYPQVL